MAISKPIRYLFFLILLTFGLTASGQGQVALSGPACVTTGIIYQYDMTGPWSDTSSFQVCITGGVFADSSTCLNGKPVSFVRVSWNEGATNGHLSLTSSVGSTSLDITITKALKGGVIDSSSHYQAVDSSQIPTSITCSVATDGNCSPSYSYQWQQSPDMLGWEDIEGASAASLSFANPILQIMYYRRKVTENGSGTVAYSNEAAIIPR